MEGGGVSLDKVGPLFRPGTTTHSLLVLLPPSFLPQPLRNNAHSMSRQGGFLPPFLASRSLSSPEGNPEPSLKRFTQGEVMHFSQWGDKADSEALEIPEMALMSR